MLAEAARIANVPFIMSSAAHASVAEATKIAPDNTWFQHYPPRDRSVGDDIIRGAADVGVKVLVMTVDVPVLPRRERNMRNGLSRGTALSLRLLLDGLLHPAWLFEYLVHGAKPPVLENWRQFAAAGANAAAVNASFFSEWPAPDQTWEDFARVRKLWPGRLLIKGVLHAADAARAVETGADGIVISNHGGRQFDRAPSPLEAMPAIRSRVGDAVPLIVEGGVRRGVDILAAFCLGAQFVLVGRPTLYGAAAGGLAGVNKAIDILRQELSVNMAQMGCVSMGTLSKDRVFFG
jgi:L-lactate dehydrogenase (cytochrome)/(S)-mandelate dehydrogenase